MFERFSRSFQLAKDSWGVLRGNKRFLIFPILSGLASILVLLSFGIPLLAISDQLQGPDGPPVWVYPLVFAFYLCSYFVIIFFNSALVSCALMKFNGQDPTVGDGLRAAWSRFPQIFAWAMVSATVGLILKAIENAHERAGQIMAAILGTAWTALTYFVVPVLVVEKVGPFAAISRSTSILKKTWGEAILGHFGIGFFSFVLFIPVLLLIFATVLCFQVSVALGCMMLAVTVVAGILWAAASSALSGIYLSALYQYAAYERVPEGFSSDTMSGAFSSKK
jgi:Family of unknown function (DUF6159)